MKKISKILLALVLSIFMGIQGLNIQIKGAAGPIRPTTYGFIAQGGDEGYNDLITKAGMEKLTYTANETTLNYWAHIPKNKDGSAVKNLPVVLYMHGYSDGGNTTAPIQYHNAILYSLIKDQEKSDRQAIILVPQTPETLQQSPTDYLNAQWVDIAGPKNDQGWSKWNNKTFDMSTKARTANLNAVLSLLNKVQQENSADLDRTYVTGMSMGGYATWDLISRDDANIFAAAVPICGVGDPTRVENMKNVPIRTFHGGSDTTISPESTRLMYHNLRKYGNISYTEYPNENHGSWESAYSNTLDDNHNGKVNIDDLIEWMFNQSRNGTLDKKVDKEPLAQIVRDAKNEEEENHTLDDWKSLQAEIVKAEALIASESATYEQTKASAKVLDELINKIVVEDKKELIINDSDTADTLTLNKITYKGNWTAENYGNNDEVFYHNDNHYSYTKEPWNNENKPSYELKFIGSSVEIYGRKNNNMATYKITIDDGEPVFADAYALVNATKQRVFKSNKLSYGAHTMVVEIADQKNEAASNDSFDAELDYIKVISPAEKVETKNLFNKDDEDVWKNALSYEGNKLSNSSYEKVFATHKIDVKPGDTLSWGNMGIDDYVLEIFKADGSYLGQIKASDIPSENIIKTGKKVLCSGNGLRYEGRLSYTFTSDEISSVRILGNMETIDKMMVFKNLNNQFVDWPTNSYVAYNQVLESTENILTGKSAIFFGDSITDASYKDEDHARWGWAGRVGTYNGMKWTNAAVDGAAISTGWDVYKDNRVIRQLENHKESYDYVILHGGMNDCLKPNYNDIGDISTSFDRKDFDTKTFSGALEELLYTATKQYKGAKIGYIINYATPNSTLGGLSSKSGPYFKRVKEICEKWGVSYIDLFEGSVVENGETKSYSQDILKVNSNTYFYNNDAGEVHIGSNGYDVIYPYVANWMKTLTTYEEKQSGVTFSGKAVGDKEYAQSLERTVTINAQNNISNISYWFETSEGNSEKTTLPIETPAKHFDKIIAFPTNTLAQKLVVEIVDDKGNINTIKDTATFKVDTETPKIICSDEEIKISEGDTIDLSSLFKVTWGVSGEGKSTITPNKSSLLSVGSHKITCEAIGENGLKSSATKIIEVKAKSIAIDSIITNKDYIELEKGSNTTVIATVLPVNATNKSLIWKSSDENIATVKDGIISAISDGIATITITSEDKNATKTIKVMVKSKKIPNKEVSNGDKTISVIGRLPENIELTSEQLTNQALIQIINRINEANKEFNKKYSIEKVYCITMKGVDGVYQPDGNVNIKIKLTKDLTNKDLKIVKIHKDGTVEQLESLVKDGFISFDTDEFGEFSIVSVNDQVPPVSNNSEDTPTNGSNQDTEKNEIAPNTGDQTYVMVLCIAIMLSFSLLIETKRRKKLNK